MQIGFALRQQFTKRCRTRRQAKTEIVETCQDGDRTGQSKRHERQRSHHGVRQYVAKHNGWVADAKSASGPDEFQVPGPEKLSPNHADESHPGKEQQ